MSLEPQQSSSKGPSRLWLPVVLTAGVLVGAILSYSIPAPFGYWEFGPNRLYGALVLHTILSTVSIALLLALAVVYIRVYAQTGARFALGITVVLFALLVQALVQYPLFLVLSGPFDEGQGTFLSFGDFFTIAAYTVFLYLSLE